MTLLFFPKAVKPAPILRIMRAPSLRSLVFISLFACAYFLIMLLVGLHNWDIALTEAGRQAWKLVAGANGVLAYIAFNVAIMYTGRYNAARTCDNMPVQQPKNSDAAGYTAIPVTGSTRHCRS